MNLEQQQTALLSLKQKHNPIRRAPMLLSVIKREVIGASLLRIHLQGPDLVGFPEHSEAYHIKLFLPLAHQSQPELPKLVNGKVSWPSKKNKPITRTYTVKKFDKEQNILQVEFALHAHPGPACDWSKRCKIGDKVGIAGPGGPYPILAPAHWHILSGDMTAVPAITALVESMPKSQKACVFLEVNKKEDIQELNISKNIQIHWLINPPSKQALINKTIAANMPVACESISAFIAGEHSQVVSIRDALKQKYKLNKALLYAVPYWASGQNEEEYHQARHQVMDEEY